MLKFVMKLLSGLWLFGLRFRVRPRRAGWLQAVKKLGGALRVGGGGEYGAFVLLEDFEPGGDISGVVLADFRGQGKVGA